MKYLDGYEVAGSYIWQTRHFCRLLPILYNMANFAAEDVTEDCQHLTCTGLFLIYLFYKTSIRRCLDFVQQLA